MCKINRFQSSKSSKALTVSTYLECTLGLYGTGYLQDAPRRNCSTEAKKITAMGSLSETKYYMSFAYLPYIKMRDILSIQMSNGRRRCRRVNFHIAWVDTIIFTLCTAKEFTAINAPAFKIRRSPVISYTLGHSAQ